MGLIKAGHVTNLSSCILYLYQSKLAYILSHAFMKNFYILFAHKLNIVYDGERVSKNILL